MRVKWSRFTHAFVYCYKNATHVFRNKCSYSDCPSAAPQQEKKNLLGFDSSPTGAFVVVTAERESALFLIKNK